MAALLTLAEDPEDNEGTSWHSVSKPNCVEQTNVQIAYAAT